jgi:hypothetical protein
MLPTGEVRIVSGESEILVAGDSTGVPSGGEEPGDECLIHKSLLLCQVRRLALAQGWDLSDRKAGHWVSRISGGISGNVNFQVFRNNRAC